MMLQLLEGWTQSISQLNDAKVSQHVNGNSTLSMKNSHFFVGDVRMLTERGMTVNMSCFVCRTSLRWMHSLIKQIELKKNSWPIFERSLFTSSWHLQLEPQILRYCTEFPSGSRFKSEIFTFVGHLNWNKVKRRKNSTRNFNEEKFELKNLDDNC